MNDPRMRLPAALFLFVFMAAMAADSLAGCTAATRGWC